MDANALQMLREVPNTIPERVLKGLEDIISITLRSFADIPKGEDVFMRVEVDTTFVMRNRVDPVT